LIRAGAIFYCSPVRTTQLVVADQIVVTGSFNLSNHAMGNAENVLLIRDAAIAELFVKYIQRLMANYAVTNDQTM
jgi:phosphatidylserine/phosphatidylglycerophosphate/cardiolipin synthase-like enzyme